MLKHITAIVFGVFIFLALLAGYFLYDSLKDEPKPYQDPQKQEDTMSAYENSAHGISFKYSPEYALSEREVGDGHRAHYSIVLARKSDLPPPQNGEGPPTISFDIYQNNLDKLSLMEWLSGTNFSNFKLSDGTYASTTVDGVEAVVYSWSGLYEGTTVAFRHRDSIIAVSGTYLTKEDQIRRDFEALIATIELQ